LAYGGKINVIDPKLLNPLAKDLMTSNWKNFGPRLGFAYRLGGSHNPFVLRGGYRMVYFPVPIRYWSATMRSNAPLTIPITEQFRLRFNADFFNVLNHPNHPNGMGNDGIISTRSQSGSARQLQLTLRLSW